EMSNILDVKQTANATLEEEKAAMMGVNDLRPDEVFPTFAVLFNLFLNIKPPAT
ncbi:hypothetical protein RUM43_012970, partial [Polyplax serrata]